ncbi:MAG: dihydropteroate synthase [Bacteroidetes bacterium]|nr:MAG: dihydropteroate synthase [Bacteroidota bacterium]
MYTLNCKGKLVVLESPIVMGILNMTPDSFYAASRQGIKISMLQQAHMMLEEGATLLDVGGQSTRPGAQFLTPQVEANRVVPAIEALHDRFPEAIISVDTFHSSVATMAVQAGASMVNDVSGGLMDPQMLTTVAALRVPYVCMHMPGTPQTMQQHAHHLAQGNVVETVLDFFIERVAACTAAGIHDVVIDPGFGFGKLPAQNFELLNQLSVFTQTLQKPLLLGVSRKSTIYKTLGITANEALNGTTVLNTVGLLNGANILRVHDVKAAVEAITLVRALAAST